jgi:hypothetical protein
MEPALSVARTAVDVRETPEAFEFVADVRSRTLAAICAVFACVQDLA